MPMWLGIGAGVGLLKNELVDAPKEKRDRIQRSEELRYSPWTHRDPTTQVKEADALGSALQGGMAAGMMGQGLQNQAAKKQLMEAQTRWMNRSNGYNHWGNSDGFVDGFKPMPQDPAGNYDTGLAPNDGGRSNPWSI